MRPIIEFCNSNMSLGTETVMKRLEKNPDYDVIEYGCLGNCGQCFDESYAMVNGTIVAAQNPEELYEKIIRVLNDRRDSYEWLDDLDD